jgi:hypothetical protein
MRKFIRPVAAALSIACLAASMAVMSADSALAQAKPAPSNQMAPAQTPPPPLKQMALTEKQIEAMLAADQQMDPVIDKMPPDTKPDAKTIAQLEAIAKKNGFASYDDYNNVSDNISLVFAGIDPATKKYVGNEGQEGGARRSQRRPEVARACDREQGQHRSCDQILRQARRRAGHRSAIIPAASRTIDLLEPRF